MQFSTKALLYCAAILAPLTAAAQQPAGTAGPADPAAAVPPVKYESAFAGYVPHREEKLAPWRDVNDEVARAGGHLGIMREAARGAAAAPGKPEAKR
jgi:hypothetical protein